MLRPINKDAPLQQGDIIRDVPFIVFPKMFNVKIPDIPGQSRINSQELDSFTKLKELSQGKNLAATTVPFVLTPGMVVTQGCDIDFKDHVTLARVFPIAHLLEEARDAIDHDEPMVLHDLIRSLTEGHEAPNLVYLGHLDGLDRCVADLMRVQSFPQDWKICFRLNRWMSFTDEGVKYVQGRLNSFTGRYALAQGFWHASDDADLAKQLDLDPSGIDIARARLEAKKGQHPAE